MSLTFIDLILALLIDSDFMIFIDAPLNCPARLLLDIKIMYLALVDPILAPNSSYRFSLKLETQREGRSRPYFKESLNTKLLEISLKMLKKIR